jgi:long-chain acyl-CoA synthetase
VALREKTFGLWRPTTWAQYAARVRAFAGKVSAARTRAA